MLLMDDQVLNLNEILQYGALALLSVLGWLMKRLWAKIDNLPKEYVPRKEIEEKDKRLDVLLEHLGSDVTEIKTQMAKSSDKLDATFERLFNKIEERQK